MPRESPREFAESMAQKMKQIIESGQEAVPIAIAQQRDGPAIIIGFEFRGDRSKDMAAHTMELLAKMSKVEYVVFLADSYVAIAEKDTFVDLSQGVKHVPGRKEAVIISIFGRNRMNEIGSWIYERIQGKIVFAEKIHWYEPDLLTGRFAPGKLPASNTVQ